MKYQTIDDLDLDGQRVIVRADLNVPVVDGNISDTTRLQRLIPTIEKLSEKGARIIILSHFGRPDGKPNPEMSLHGVSDLLSKMIGKRIIFSEKCLGSQAEAIVNSLASSEIALLENLRFHKGEEANDPSFASALANLGDFYVNDAFSVCHRAHASTSLLAELLPNAAGPQVENEVHNLNSIFEGNDGSVAAIVGGSKISTKIQILESLICKVNVLIVGGGMANTFLYAKGFDVGESIFEPDLKELALKILLKAGDQGCKVIIPSDAVVAQNLQRNDKVEELAVDSIPSGKMILDIGSKTINEIIHSLEACKTVVWNGPLGAFETKPFNKGTDHIAKAISDLTQSNSIISVAGGGETLSALSSANAIENFSYVSAAGGAFLEWLEGKKLPGLEVLEKRKI